ncbi:MAG: hypothetical protein RL651_906 [Pseudomonadota bacterium]|jgi:hypothetical protein
MTENPWNNDVLNRTPYADFLTAYLVSKFKASTSKPKASFTLALDAQWGLGKSFFITNWSADLANAEKPHPTFVFDAWQADHTADPLIAFMAAFKAALDERINAAGLDKTAKQTITNQISVALSGFRRAILPAGKEIGKGVLRKTTGIAAEKVYEAWISESGTSMTRSTETISEAGLDSLNKGLDVFFDQLLADQKALEQAIGDFKEGIERTLETLAEADVVTLPMFVFVDELDRCRPNFAIELLEGIKHLFGINGVCFVVATNMAQLSESVKAIYGANFDGYSYLKRFFNVEYALPPCKNHDYMRLLLGEYPELSARELDLGLPYQDFVGESEPKDICFALTWVADTFELDLRSQRTVLEMISASAAGVPQGKKVHLLWLAILCAMKHKHPNGFDRLANSSENSTAFTDDAWEVAVRAEPEKTIALPRGFGTNTRAVKLRDVAWVYYSLKELDLKKVREAQEEPNLYDYPDCLSNSFFSELPGQYLPGKAYPPSIAGYFELVKTAGHFVGG